MAETIKFSFSKLGNGNYPTWKFQMEMLLSREDLFYVIEDEKPENETHKWKKDDKKARATIGLCVEESQFGLIKDAVNAKSMWTSLQEYHEKNTVTSRVSLLKRLCSKSLPENGNMETHIQEVEVMFDRLKGAGLALEKDVKVAMLLRTLPESYNSLVIALESRPDADITLELIKSKLLDEYQKRLERGSSMGDTKSLRTVAAKSGEKVCFHCKKPGHFRKNCRKYQASLRGDSSETKQQEKQGSAPKAKQSKDSRSPLLFWAKVENATTRMVNTDQEVHCSVGGFSALWYIDSGASQHMTCNRSFFTEMTDFRVGIVLANGKTTESQGIGSGVLRCLDNLGNERVITVQNVLFVPELDGSLLSVSVIVANHCSVSFDSNGCQIRDPSGVVSAVAEQNGGMFVLKTSHKLMASTTKRHTENCQHTWHRRFGHRDFDVIRQITKQQLGAHMKVVDCGIKTVCQCCLEGKMARKPISKEAAKRKNEVLDLIHTDVVGPFKDVTPGGNSFFMTLIDDYSRYTTVYLLANKSDVAGRIMEFVRLMETQRGKKPRIIRSNKGREYINDDLEAFYAAEGILTEYTTPGTAQKNEVAERKNR